MFKDVFKGVSTTAERAAHINVALLTAAILILALFAVAHLTALMFPPSGQAQKVTKIVIGACIAAILLVAIWCVRAVQT